MNNSLRMSDVRTIAFALLIAAFASRGLPTLGNTALLSGGDFSMSTRLLYVIAVTLVVFDVGLVRLNSRWRRHAGNLRTAGMWVLVGLFLNTLMVVAGILAILWTRFDTLPLLQSMLSPFFEFAGIAGPAVFAVFTMIGLFRGLRSYVPRILLDAPPENDYLYRGTDYRKILLVGLLFVVVPLVMSRLSLPGTDIQLALNYIVLPAVFAGVLHIAAVATKLFGRDPWKEPATELMRGGSLAVVVYAVLSGLDAPIALIAEQSWASSAVQPLYDFSTIMVGLSIWIAMYIALATSVRAFSMYAARDEMPWFYDRLGDEPGIMNRYLWNGAIMVVSAFVLLDSSGPIAAGSSVDLSALAMPAYGMIGAVISSRFILLFWPSQKGVALAGAIEWIGIGQFVAFLLHDLPAAVLTLEFVPGLGSLVPDILPFTEAVSDASWWFVAAFGITALTKIAGNLEPAQNRAGFATLVSAMSFVAFGWVGWSIADAFAVFGPGYHLLGAVFLGATAGAAFGLVARYSAEHPHPIIATPSRWLSESRFRAMNMGGFLAAYLLVLRPTIVDAFVFSILIEWVIIALLAVYVSRRTWTAARDQSAPETHARSPENWTQHRQEIEVMPEEQVSVVLRLQERFVNTGETTTLAMRCALGLWDQGMSVDDIAVAIRPLLLSTNKEPGWLSRTIASVVPRPKAMREQAVREDRQQVLAVLTDRLEESVDARTRRSRSGSSDVNQLFGEISEEFIAGTDPARLFAVSAVLLWIQGVGRNAVSTIVRPLAMYREPGMPWYAVGPLQKRKRETFSQERSRHVSSLRKLVGTRSS